MNQSQNQKNNALKYRGREYDIQTGQINHVGVENRGKRKNLNNLENILLQNSLNNDNYKIMQILI